MTRWQSLPVLLVFGVSIFAIDQSRGENQRIRAFLEKASDFEPQEKPDQFYAKLGWLLAVEGDLPAAFDAVSKIVDNRILRRERQKLIQTAIFTDRIAWLKENKAGIDFEADFVVAAHAILAASRDDSENALQLAESVDEPKLRERIFCELVTRFSKQGKAELAQEVFVRALTEQKKEASLDLFDAALELDNGPLAREMYRRLTKGDPSASSMRLRLLYQMGLTGHVEDAVELSEEWGTDEAKRFRSRLPYQISLSGTEQAVKELVRLASDDGPYAHNFSTLSYLFKDKLKKGKLAEAESICAEIHSLVTTMPNLVSLPKVATLSLAYSKIEDEENAKRLAQTSLQRLNELLESRKDPKSFTHNLTQESFIEGIMLTARACGKSGDEESETRLLEMAMGMIRPNRNGTHQLSRLALWHVVDFYLQQDQLLDARDLLIKLVDQELIAQRAIADSGSDLKPLIDRLVQKHGKQEALKFLGVLKSRSPRVTIIKLVAEAQLRKDGPDADLEWVMPRRKDVPVGDLYLAAAEEESQQRIAEISELLQAMSLNWYARNSRTAFRFY